MAEPTTSPPQDTGGGVFHDPVAMSEVAAIFRRGMARCGPDCELHHRADTDTKAAS